MTGSLKDKGGSNDDDSGDDDDDNNQASASPLTSALPTSAPASSSSISSTSVALGTSIEYQNWISPSPSIDIAGITQATSLVSSAIAVARGSGASSASRSSTASVPPSTTIPPSSTQTLGFAYEISLTIADSLPATAPVGSGGALGDNQQEINCADLGGLLGNKPCPASPEVLLSWVSIFFEAQLKESSPTFQRRSAREIQVIKSYGSWAHFSQIRYGLLPKIHPYFE